MRNPLVAATATALALSACAATDADPSGTQAAVQHRAVRACFSPQQVVNFRTVRSQTLYVKTFTDDVFEISTSGCLDLDSSYSIAITPVAGINDRLCVGDRARIALPDSSIPQTPCRARVLRGLTPAEVAALPERDRP